jgi:hypothetical protein
MALFSYDQTYRAADLSFFAGSENRQVATKHDIRKFSLYPTLRDSGSEAFVDLALLEVRRKFLHLICMTRTFLIIVNCGSRIQHQSKSRMPSHGIPRKRRWNCPICWIRKKRYPSKRFCLFLLLSLQQHILRGTNGRSNTEALRQSARYYDNRYHIPCTMQIVSSRIISNFFIYR